MEETLTNGRGSEEGEGQIHSWSSTEKLFSNTQSEVSSFDLLLKAVGSVVGKIYLS